MKETVHESCIGCKKVSVDQFCIVYIKPSIWWDKRGGCPLATHAGVKLITDEKKRVGQQKQKKKTRK
jgi:hypothetical protein